MRLHASGGLSLVNTTDPGATNLSVSGSLTVAGTTIQINNAAPLFVANRSASSGGAYMEWQTATTRDWLLGTQSGITDELRVRATASATVIAIWKSSDNSFTLGSVAGTGINPFYAGAGTFGGALTVAGKATAADTIRSGDYVTYSYFIPGGALVQSSSQDLKENIRSYTADLSKFFLVKPRKYTFKKENFIRLFDESTLSDTLTVNEKGELRKKFREENLREAEAKSKREMIGFLAEEFNAIIGKDSKEVNQQDVINVLWLKVQELEARVAKLEKR